MASYAVASLIALGTILIVLLLIRPAITTAQGGKILAFIALFILPIVTTALGTSIHLEQSKSTQFCLSCHVMEPYGRSLLIDDPTYLPAAHFQNNRIPREQACFTCHTNYTMFGDFNSKLRGLRHVYVHYFKASREKIALYEPFENRECLHCHAGARSYEETTPHKEMQQQIAANAMSCLTCHNKIHDVPKLQTMKLWKEPR